MSVAEHYSEPSAFRSHIWPTPPKNGRGIKLPPYIIYLCHGIRIAIIVLLIWRFWNITSFFLDFSHVAADVLKYDKLDISDISSGQYFMLYLVNLTVAWGLQAGIYLSLFQLFGGFIQGEVFTPQSGTRLRRAGLFDLAYIIATPLRYTLAMAVITAHLPGGVQWHMPDLLNTSPLYDFILGGTAIILGQVFKVAAEIAQENSEIV